MQIALTIITILAISAGFILLLVLLIPYRIHIFGAWNDPIRTISGYLGTPLRLLGIRLAVSNDGSHAQLFFFRFSPYRRPFTLFKKRTKDPKQSKNKQKQKQPQRAKRTHKVSIIETLYTLKTLHIRIILKRLLTLINPHGSVSADVGFEDPADTAACALCVSLLKEMAPGLNIDIKPHFETEIIKGEFTFTLTIWLPQILVGLLVIAFSNEGRHLIKNIRKSRRNRIPQAAEQ